MATDRALRLASVQVRYGGVVAVDDVSLDVEAGSMTGLIGPNGAGKSSLFGACAGTVRAAGGTIELFGTDVTKRSAAARGHLGIGRTFQKVELFRTMTVEANVAMGHEASYVRRNPASLLWASRAERRRSAAVAEDVLGRCGLLDLRDRVAGSLSTGQQRMVELARVLASPARLLLLDEPSSGLSGEDRRRFTSILRGNATRDGRSVFIVEHDMDLVAGLCTTVHVLNFGRIIFSGDMAAALRNRAVQESYLGTGGTDDAAPLAVGDA